MCKKIRSINIPKILVSLLIFFMSFNANAFPVVIGVTTAGALAPLLMALVFGRVITRKSKIKMKSLAAFSLFIVFLMFSSASERNHSEFMSSTIKYSIDIQSTDVSKMPDIPSIDLMSARALINGDPDSYFLAYISDERKLYSSKSGVYGYMEHERLAADILNLKKVPKEIFVYGEYSTQEKVISNNLSKIVDLHPIMIRFPNAFPEPTCSSANCKLPKQKSLSEFESESKSFFFFKDAYDTYKKYNIIYIGDFLDSYKLSMLQGDIIVFAADFMVRRKDVIKDLKLKVDMSKPFFIFNLSFRGNSVLRNEIKNEILIELGIQDYYYSEDDVFLSNFNTETKDNNINTAAVFANRSRFISPEVHYAATRIMGEEFKYLCFSDKCSGIFGDKSIDLVKEGIVSFDYGYFINEEKLKRKIMKNDKLIVVPEDVMSLNLGISVASLVYNAGYNFTGFTYNPALYSGINDSEFVAYSNADVVTAFFDFSLFDRNVDMGPLSLVIAVSLITLIFSFIASVKIRFTSAFALLFLLLAFKGNVYLGSDYLNNKISEELFFTLYLLISLLASVIKNNRSPRVFLALSSCVVSTYYLDCAINVFDDVYLLVTLGALIGLLTYVIIERLTKINEEDCEIKSVLGDKYSITSRHSKPSDSGFIVDSKNYVKISKSLSEGKKFLLRSNHISMFETSYSGIYTSHIVMKSTLIGVFEKEHDKLTKDLNDSSIQFWLVPYKEYKLKGVVSSVASDITCIGISYDQGDNVTSGTGGKDFKVSREHRFTLVDLASKEERLKIRLFKLVKRIESLEKTSVIIEFGLTRFGLIDILQVKHHNDLSIKRTIVSDLISNKYSKILDAPQSILGADILNAITENTLLAYHKGIAIKTLENTNETKDYLLSDSHIVPIIDNLLSVRYESSTASSVVADIELILRPVIEIYTTGTSALEFPISNELKNSFFKLQNISNEKGRLPTYDISDLVVNIGLIKSEVDLSSLSGVKNKDVLSMIIRLSLLLIKVSIEKKHLNNDDDIFSLLNSTILEVDNGIRKRLDKNLMNKNNVIVNGDFTGKKCDLACFLVLSEFCKSECILECDYIPEEYIFECMKAKAIILKVGTELSHSVMTAKATGTPIMIIN